MGLGGSKPVEFDANAYIARAHEIFQKEKRGEEIRWQDIAELFSRTLTDEELAMILKNKEGREVLRRGGALARTFYHDKGQLQAVDTTRGVATQVTRVIEILYRAGLKEEGKAFGQEVCADAKKHRVGKTAVPYWEGDMLDHSPLVS